MNYDRIYQYRFQNVDSQKKYATWNILSRFLYNKLGKPTKVIDPAAGNCEFINQIPAKERWAVDINPSLKDRAANDIKFIIGNNLEVELPESYFEGVFISNFLEHLHSQEEVALFLERMYKILKPRGHIAIMGPNFKYAWKEYFDFADHTVILSELGIAEHLYGAGFIVKKIYPRFLPLSFRGNLPVTNLLIKLYLNMPWSWRFLGKQFLLLGTKN